MSGRRKFISKKNATTYRLVRCSEAGPDGDPSGHVFVPVNEVKQEKFSAKLPACALLPPSKEILNQKKQMPLGGLQPEFDPDVVAALDDDCSHEGTENALEDDFVAMANGEIQVSNKFESDSENGDSDDELLLSSDEGRVSFDFDDDEEEKPYLPTYSLTSAVSNCDENVKMINERFEKFCATYDDEQIGALDFEEIEGFHKPDEGTLKDLEEHSVEYKKELHAYDNNIDDDLKHKIQHYVGASDEEESSSEEEVDEQAPQYDCESIISTYSNKHNHPTLIKAEKKERVKIPANLYKQTLTKSNLRQLDRERDVRKQDAESVALKNEEIFVSSWNGRQKNETPEAKRLRKQAHKQHKRESRMIKKENKLAFKEHKEREKAVVLNANRSKFVPLF